MKYRNAMDIFPEELIAEIRKYITEGIVYIPNMEERKAWGSVAGQKIEMEQRNQMILNEYQKGKPVNRIAKEQYLSISSIYRIIHNQKLL